MKRKVAIFGVTSFICEVVQNNLNMENIELVCWIDNDSTKKGVVYEEIPILPLNQVPCETLDYVIVAAWHSYDEIRAKLIDAGFMENQIGILLCDEAIHYFLGVINPIEDSMLEALYLEPENVKKIIDCINVQNNVYGKIEPFTNSGNEWFDKSTLISHACGGYVGTKRRMYSNSKEALEYSLKKGFLLIECDVWGMEDGEAILAHSYMDLEQADKEGYTLQNLGEVLEKIKEHPHVSLLIDVKWNTIDDFRRVVNHVEQKVDALTWNEDEKNQLKNQIIMEVYNEPTMIYARDKGYECIYTQYRNLEWKRFTQIASLCNRYNVKAVALRIGMVYEMEKYLHVLTDKGIKIFCFSTDKIEDYAKLMKANVSGVFTNFLTEK